MNGNAFSDIVKGFESAPYLFIGSGFSRRYYNVPCWPDLLDHFARLVRSKDPEEAFNYYLYMSGSILAKPDYARMASLIADDFNKKWFNDIDFRSNFSFSETKGFAFKKALAEYISSFNAYNTELKEELDLFKNVCSSCIFGVITTNYDENIEKLSKFEPYVGQNSLLTSRQSGLAEVYKIHGSVTDPDSMVITSEDYEKFDSKAKYLSAKLMTILFENPIIFMGYSLTDENIRSLFKNILDSFDSTDKENLDKFQNRLYFVEWNSNVTDIELKSFTMDFGANYITMKHIIVPDFKCVFEPLLSFRLSLPVRTMRFLEKQFVDYIYTNEANATVKVADLHQDSVSIGDLAIYVGRKQQMDSMVGLIGKESNDVFLDILYDDIGFSAEDVLFQLLPRIEKGNAKLPKYKYYANISDRAITKDLRDNFPQVDMKTLLNSKEHETRPINQILKEEVCYVKDDSKTKNYNIALRKMVNIDEENVCLDSLESCLKEFIEKRNALGRDINKASINPTYIRKLILMYDYVLYKKRAMENLSFRKSDHHDSDLL